MCWSDAEAPFRLACAPQDILAISGPFFDKAAGRAAANAGRQAYTSTRSEQQAVGVNLDSKEALDAARDAEETAVAAAKESSTGSGVVLKAEFLEWCLSHADVTAYVGAAVKLAEEIVGREDANVSALYMSSALFDRDGDGGECSVIMRIFFL